MIVRTFETAEAAVAFVDRFKWPLARNQPSTSETSYRIDEDGVTRQLRSRRDRHGEFWYWGRM